LRGLGKEGRLCIATVTRLEVRAGMLPDEHYVTQKLLSRFVNIDLDRRIADRAGEYLNAVRLSSSQAHVPDAIIAATATIHNLTLVTLNKADFDHIPGLRLYSL
jgi:predicted nucleic acid-binding protein